MMLDRNVMFTATGGAGLMTNHFAVHIRTE